MSILFPDGEPPREKGVDIFQLLDQAHPVIQKMVIMLVVLIITFGGIGLTMLKHR